MYQNKIINIHPALLPKHGGKGFYGLRVHRAVLDAGDQESGCTVHYVNENYDEGDVIRQAKVPVHQTDTPEKLAGRILKAEHKLLPSVIKQIINQNK
jgi:phosphoribosylglycinamide formyltransferase 1